MTLNNGNPQQNEIDLLIDQTYQDLMLLRVEYSALKKSGRKDLEDLMKKIESLNEDFEGFIKTKTLYNKYQKSMGISTANASAELIAKIKEIKSTVGSIVSLVPRT